MKKQTPTSTEIAYAAGLLEGEGCFSIHSRSSRPNTISCSILCEMTDEEPITALKDIFNVGQVYHRENIRSDGKVRKPSWIWAVQKRADVLLVLDYIYPMLISKRRITKVIELLKELRENSTNES